MPPPLRRAISGAVARVTLDRPEVLNAGDARWVGALTDAVDDPRRHPDLRVVVVTGARVLHRRRPRRALTRREASEFSGALEQVVERVLAPPPTSVRAGKRLATRAFDVDFETFRKEMTAALAGCLASEERRAAMRARRGHRSP